MSGIRRSSSGDCNVAKVREIPLEWKCLTRSNAAGKFSQRAAAAYHVAGQANRLARVHVATVKAAWVNPDGGGLVMSCSRSDMTDQELRGMLIALVAGQEAECRYLMSRDRWCSYRDALRATHFGASVDRETFKQLSEGTGYTFEGLLGEAHRLLRWREYPIECIAKSLDRKGFLGEIHAAFF